MEIRIHDVTNVDGVYDLEFDNSKIRIWADNDKEEEILPGTTDLGDTAHTLFVEGIAASSSLADVQIIATAPFAGQGEDVIRLTVVAADLDIIDEQGMEVSEEDENLEGAFVQYNIDDDDADGTIDIVDSNGILGENDLVSLTLRPIENSVLSSVDGVYELGFDSSKVRIWKNADRTGTVTSGVTDFDPDVTTVVYVEGYAESEATISLHFEFDAAPPTGGDLVVDELKVVIAGSILVAIDGTGSEAFSETDNFLIEFDDGSGIVRTQSHLRNFYDDYFGVDKKFLARTGIRHYWCSPGNGSHSQRSHSIHHRPAAGQSQPAC